METPNGWIITYTILISLATFSILIVFFALYNQFRRTPEEKLLDACDVPRNFKPSPLPYPKFPPRPNQTPNVEEMIRKDLKDFMYNLLREIEALKSQSEINAPTRTQQWLPIEKTPKDGALVLLISSRYQEEPHILNLRFPMFGYWRNDVSSWVCYSRNPIDVDKLILDSNQTAKCNPTHFLPIPIFSPQV